MATIKSLPASPVIPSSLDPAGPTPKLSLKITSRKRSSTTKTQRKSKTDANLVEKPKQTKSRNGEFSRNTVVLSWLGNSVFVQPLIHTLGCKNCKEKRLKCDEEKPSCKQCEKKGTICKGYEKVLKWRPQEDSFRNHTVPAKPRKCRPHNDYSKRVLLIVQDPTVPKRSRPPPTSPSSTHTTESPNSNSYAPYPPSDPNPQEPTLPLHPQLSQQADPLTAHNESFMHSAQQHDDYRTHQSFLLESEDSFASATPSLMNETFNDDTTPQSTRTLASSLWSGQSPCLAERLLPGIDLYTRPSDLMDFQHMESIPAYQSNDLPSCALQNSTSFFENDVEEIIRESDGNDGFMIPLSPTHSDSSSSSGGSWFDSFTATLMGQPKLHRHSEEMLVMRFETETCGILSIKNGPTENPWSTMLRPLAQSEPALHHAISAMTAFHASKEERDLRIIGMEHMNQSLLLLSHNIGSMRPDAALSTTLVLAFCESWDLLVSTGIAHLQGAKKLIVQLLRYYQQGTMLPENEECVGFLIRTWVYMDVIARLTSLDCDDSEDFDILYKPICQDTIRHQGIDPLMGCASTMFPIIGRVSNLVRKVRKTARNSFNAITEANILKAKLEKWRPLPNFDEPQDNSTDVEQALWTAEAYRSATLLYLYQAVPGISLDSVTEKIAVLSVECLTSLANVPVTSGAVIVHIFPLLAAGCEATDPETRRFVEDRWLAMMQRMKIGNLDKCLEAVKEVWERRDSHEAEKERNKARVIAPNLRSRDIPTTVMKRKIRTADDTGAHDVEVSSGNGKRRAVQDSTDAPRPGHVRRESTVKEEKLEYDLTVRGRCHWAGVMKDWKWEGESCLWRLCQMFAELSQCFLDRSHNTTLRAVLDHLNHLIPCHILMASRLL